MKKDNQLREATRRYFEELRPFTGPSLAEVLSQYSASLGARKQFLGDSEYQSRMDIVAKLR